MSRADLEVRLERVEAVKGGLFDRTPHISNPIYAATGGRDGFIPEPELRDRLLSIEPILVYCRMRSEERMLESMSRAAKLHKPAEHVEKVIWAYPEVVRLYDLTMALYETQIPVIRFDRDFDLPGNVLNILRDLEAPKQEGI